MHAFVGTVCLQRTAEWQQTLKNASQDLTGELPTASLVKMSAARTLEEFGSSQYAPTSHTNICMRTFIHCRLGHISSESCHFPFFLSFLLLQTLLSGSCLLGGEVWYTAKPVLPARWCTTCGAGFGTSALPDEREMLC